MTFRERVDANPVGWLVSVGAACFVAGVLVAAAIIQARNSVQGPHDVTKNPTEPSRAPIFQVPVGPTETKTPPPIASATPADSGNIEMTIQQFTRRFLELDGRYAEQENFLKRADRKRVRWQVIFISPLSLENVVTAYFDVPAERLDEGPLRTTPVRWASFPANFHDRLYSLKRGDLIEISGVLKNFGTYVTIQADDFEIVPPAAPALTPTPKI